jgi:hypothetical protein
MSPQGIRTAILVGLSIGLVYLYSFYMYLFRLWEEVPVEFARTTPKKVAGFSLIPIVGCFWWYTAFVGLHEDMNKTMKSYGLGTRFCTAWLKIACIYWFVFYIAIIICNICNFGCCGNIGNFIMGACLLFILYEPIITITVFLCIPSTVFRFISEKTRTDMNAENQLQSNRKPFIQALIRATEPPGYLLVFLIIPIFCLLIPYLDQYILSPLDSLRKSLGFWYLPSLAVGGCLVGSVVGWAIKLVSLCCPSLFEQEIPPSGPGIMKKVVIIIMQQIVMLIVMAIAAMVVSVVLEAILPLSFLE